MGLNHRNNINQLHLATPLLDSAGNVEGWFKFDDDYLSPEVRYTAFPPTTWLKIGSRVLEVDRAVPLKIRLLEAEEDYHFWCKKKQHGQRINCGEYHKDFGDIEIGYSFSSPQTHIWFAGYAIHADCFENCCFSSHNASVRVTPEHILPKSDHPLFGPKTPNSPNAVGSPGVPLSDVLQSKSLFQMVVEEGADLPIYTAVIPKRVETNKGYTTEMVPCAEFINDCEREIIKRESFDVGAAVAQRSDPTSYPPTYPPVKPFEHPGLFWSYVYNQLLAKRLARDELDQAMKDIALLNRMSQYERESIQKDKRYRIALERLANLFATHEAVHKQTWPARRKDEKKCRCVICERQRADGKEPDPLHEAHQHVHDHHVKGHRRHRHKVTAEEAVFPASTPPQPPRRRYSGYGGSSGRTFPSSDVRTNEKEVDEAAKRLTEQCSKKVQTEEAPRPPQFVPQNRTPREMTVHGLLSSQPGTTPLTVINAQYGEQVVPPPGYHRVAVPVPSVLDTTQQIRPGDFPRYQQPVRQVR